ncbi:glutaredoxin [candidate division WOR-3 bacterium]|uniref:Glutaredoxin n=1 Tax=candidate division WOR-3 bacterium TaxID=2052148 RepID=A0A937XES0_UNCW3|nr:glutaredoxin [candidate division WOR-3 bacterium]
MLLAHPVRIVLFKEESGCQFCKEAVGLAQELAQLSGKLTVEIMDLQKDAPKAAEYHVDKVPAFVVAGERDYGIRYYGVPAGYEFTTLLTLVELVGSRDSGLQPESRSKLSNLTSALDLQMFVTLTCPVCPVAAVTAARVATESDRVSLSIIDAAEFPQLAGLYNVMAVPRTVVNRVHSFEGALPEARFVEEVLKGASGLVAL